MAAPFHRRILPWIFITVFLALAPALIFYTSGYRWNPKKGVVERNGTVILDSTPSGAAISIDSQLVSETTPVTFQDIAPGLHRFTVTKKGYYSWEKSLDVRPELVTFANQISLWKDAAPVVESSAPAFAIFASPDDRTVIFARGTTSTEFQIVDSVSGATRRVQFIPHSMPAARLATPQSLASDVATPVNAEWSSNGRYALLMPATGSPLLLDARATTPPIELPKAVYRWENSDLVGNDGTSLITLRLPNLGMTKTMLTGELRDSFDGGELRISSSTRQLILVEHRLTDIGFVLPSGSWTYAGQTKQELLFRDGVHWLSVSQNTSQPESHTADGDMLRRFSSSSGDRFLLVNGGELWLWDPAHDPELLTRQSDQIRFAAWHHAGNDVFLATSKNVSVLNLDQRDGRLLTSLATFDEVTDVALLKNQLEISGTLNGKGGVWTVDVE